MGHFYFVRHGQTVWNVENKICGCTDSPLTEYGREQARETGRKSAKEQEANEGGRRYDDGCTQAACLAGDRADP